MKTNSSNAKRVVTGILFVIFGILLLLRNFYLLPPKIEDIFLSWPMLLIAVGLVSLAGRNYTAASIIIFTGCFFLVPRIIDIEVKLKQFWPIIIIFTGLAILSQWRSKNKKGDKTLAFSDYIDEFNILSSKNYTHQSPTFKGGRISSILAGVNVDFKGVKLDNTITTLDVTSILGSVKLFVPTGWTIKNDLSNVLGGILIKNKDANTDREENVLVITGRVVLGNVEVVYV
ncbi:MAG: LiaF transmembrane domain-containing protein [Salinivirgaceae bacterium]|jgi:predicted membrane protein|nr:cell wall-active antibiotics response protein [Bacteroidales bacterium]